MNNQIGSYTDRGQVLVLVVLAVIALLGFTALAIDGSMLYSNRRHAQNTADASSLAAGGAAAQWMKTNGVSLYNWNCGGLTGASNAAKAAAITRAAQNGFIITSVADEASLPDPKMGVYTTCDQSGKYLDIHTWVSQDTPTAFAHLVFQGQLRSTVESVVRVRPPSSLAYGYAIVALNPAQCSGASTGVGFQGTSDTIVNGGGIFSNGCLKSGGSFTVEVNNGNVRYNFIKNPSDDDNIVVNGGTIEQTTEKIPPSAYAVPPINCAGAVYQGGWPPPVTSGKVTNMSPGLYCITGNISINSKDEVYGSGVTIYVMNGKLTINGGAKVVVSAPAQGSNPAYAIEGLLWYLPPSNTSAVKLNGNSESIMQGTILAPSAGITFDGTEGLQMVGQIIGWDVLCTGTSGSGVTFNGGVTALLPTLLDLYK